jgi:hypothetical protein
MDITTCPECGAGAEIVDRAVLESTHGPMEHVRIHCVRRHWFFMPVDSLPAARVVAARRHPSATEA